MKTASALIIGAAALLQLNGFVSAETCASYVDYDTGNTLCGPSGILTTSEPEDITCADEFVCTHAECCIAETCATDYDVTTPDCGSNGLLGAGSGDTPADNDCAGRCTFTECCEPETCADWVGGAGSTVCAGMTLNDVSAATNCADKECTAAECCTKTCASHTCQTPGNLLKANAPSIDCATAGDDSCNDSECCDSGSPVYCASYTCAAAGQTVPLSKATDACTTACDDAQCCEPMDVTCAEKIYSCPTGTTRIDSNICDSGTCTDLLCCSTVTESTITEARMMRTPRSRISGTQYGA